MRAIDVLMQEHRVIERVLDALETAAGHLERDSLSPIDRRPIATPDQLPPVDLGYLSRATDALICRAIVEGCRRPLAEGLRLESEVFGACCATEDMGIGVGNFIANGPRAMAAFVHR